MPNKPTNQSRIRQIHKTPQHPNNSNNPKHNNQTKKQICKLNNNPLNNNNNCNKKKQSNPKYLKHPKIPQQFSLQANKQEMKLNRRKNARKKKKKQKKVQPKKKAPKTKKEKRKKRSRIPNHNNKSSQFLSLLSIKARFSIQA